MTLCIIINHSAAKQLHRCTFSSAYNYYSYEIHKCLSDRTPNGNRDIWRCDPGSLQKRIWYERVRHGRYCGVQSNERSLEESRSDESKQVVQKKEDFKIILCIIMALEAY